MKKKLFSIIAGILAIAMLVPCTFISASADSTDEVTVKLGDVDGDGVLTPADSLAILRYTVHLDRFEAWQKKASDVDQNGIVDAADALRVLRDSVGLTDSLYGDGPIKDYAYRILDLINIERAKVGVEPLEIDETLCQLSEKRAEEISYLNELEHMRSDGSRWDTILREYNVVWYKKGENIGAGQTADKIFDAWMNSEVHRHNMLDPDFRKLGVGYYFNKNSRYGYYWSTNFTDTVSADESPVGSVAADGTVKEYTEVMLDLINAERARAGVAPVKLDTTLCKVAKQRAEEISYLDRLEDQTRRDGRNWKTIFDEYGIRWTAIGEDVGAAQSAEKMFNLWMGSENHRANILNPKFSKFGVGYYYNTEGTYGRCWAVDFTN